MTRTLYLFFATLLLSASAHAQIISTIAGTGIPGALGDGTPATAAMIDNPYGIAMDTAGNIYLADYGTNRVRKINPAGIITTFTGTGSSSSAGDGGPATAASVYGPIGVACDGVGNVYISEYLGGRIRKVDPTDTISTFIASGLTAPTGICTDTAGNLYIANQTSARVLRATPGGAVTIVAGNGTFGYLGDGGPATAAELNSVTGVAADRFGNIYASCWNDVHVRKIDAAGQITTVAGNASGFGGDGGPATAAALNQPYFICTDVAGNLYISDVSNDRIRKVTTATGTINTIAGTGSVPYGGDGVPATAANMGPLAANITPAGNVLIADAGNHRLREIVYLPAITGVTTLCTDSSVILADSSGGGTWSSHSTVIATIDMSTGELTGVGTGTTTITYTMGPYYTTTTVTINTLPNPGFVVGASSICAGATTAFTDAIGGGTWSSSSPGVATISVVGLARGVAAGTTVISFTKTNLCGSSSAIQALTVNDIPSAGTISGPDTVCDVTTGITLTSSVAGGLWQSTNGNATVTSGAVHGVTPGVDTILYVVANTCGADTAQHVVTVSDCPSAVKQAPYNAEESLNIYPNPTTGDLTINLSSAIEERVDIVITNLVGEKIGEFSIAANKDRKVSVGAAKGIYFISAMTGHSRFVQKIIIE